MRLSDQLLEDRMFTDVEGTIPAKEGDRVACLKPRRIQPEEFQSLKETTSAKEYFLRWLGILLAVIVVCWCCRSMTEDRHWPGAVKTHRSSK